MFIGVAGDEQYYFIARKTDGRRHYLTVHNSFQLRAVDDST